MTMPFVWLGGSLSKIRGGRSHGIRCDPRGASPATGRKMGGPWQDSWKRAIRRPFPRTLKSSKQPGKPIIYPTKEYLPRRGPMTWCQFLGDGLGNKPPECRDTWGTGGLGWQAGTEGCQPCCKSLPMGHTVFLHSVTKWVTQHHGVEGDILHWGPTLVRWLLILPLVWEGGAEWSHGSKSHMNHTLLPRPHMCLVLGLLHHEFRHYEMAHIPMWVPNHKG